MKQITQIAQITRMLFDIANMFKDVQPDQVIFMTVSKDPRYLINAAQE